MVTPLAYMQPGSLGASLEQQMHEGQGHEVLIGISKRSIEGSVESPSDKLIAAQCGRLQDEVWAVEKQLRAHYDNSHGEARARPTAEAGQLCDYMMSSFPTGLQDQAPELPGHDTLMYSQQPQNGLTSSPWAPMQAPPMLLSPGLNSPAFADNQSLNKTSKTSAVTDLATRLRNDQAQQVSLVLVEPDIGSLVNGQWWESLQTRPLEGTPEGSARADSDMLQQPCTCNSSPVDSRDDFESIARRVLRNANQFLAPPMPHKDLTRYASMDTGPDFLDLRRHHSLETIGSLNRWKGGRKRAPQGPPLVRTGSTPCPARTPEESRSLQRAASGGVELRGGALVASSLSSSKLESPSRAQSLGDELKSSDLLGDLEWLRKLKEGGKLPDEWEGKPPTSTLKAKSEGGASRKPKPWEKGRQVLNERIQELRRLVPKSERCSLEILLERTAELMKQLKSSIAQAQEANTCSMGVLPQQLLRRSCQQASEARSLPHLHANQHPRCSLLEPIFVEILPGGDLVLVEVLCGRRELYLQAAAGLQALGLSILKGNLQVYQGTFWLQYIAQGLRSVQVELVLHTLTALLQQHASFC